MKPYVFALAIAAACPPAVATPTGFVERPRVVSGAAIVESAVGGEYAYADQLRDARVRTRPFLARAPVRQSYVFFSAEEEQALLRYHGEQLAKHASQRLAAIRKRPASTGQKLNWPRVVVRPGEICVPELAKSEAPDWREHLVCHGAEAAL